ncbi:DUF805 domain-containing protein [Caulobacter sp. BE254]|uniref:DUF805 domain-containing protein n=1 Tax=Caulobacter sp. BE254 TaxID=2817720 RepID=UPI00285D3143|nr:DUF805 domain-containing protein [Caulobacter sp. BE254]MDR7116690.1 uncharacterized membrane protein YhaH (DUF805 family) [Caulobacter sp. BE254]
MDWKSLFFSAEGRIGRQVFWIGWLMLLGAHVVAGWIPLVGQVIGLIAVFAWVCLCTKRLHDMGRSGWWQLLPILLGPVLIIGSAMSIGIGAILGEITNTDWAALAGVGGLLVSVAIAFIAVAAFTLWVGVTEGQPGENRYGEPPLTRLMA